MLFQYSSLFKVARAQSGQPIATMSRLNSIKFSLDIVEEHFVLFLLQDGVLFFFVNLGLLCGMGKFACTYCC